MDSQGSLYNKVFFYKTYFDINLQLPDYVCQYLLKVLPFVSSRGGPFDILCNAGKVNETG